jgi:hypothetical protein
VSWMRGNGLSFRDWRWSWLSLALGLIAGTAFLVPWIVLYIPARGIVAGFDFISSRVWAAHIALINKDIARKHGHARKHGAHQPDGWLP